MIHCLGGSWILLTVHKEGHGNYTLRCNFHSAYSFVVMDHYVVVTVHMHTTMHAHAAGCLCGGKRLSVDYTRIVPFTLSGTLKLGYITHMGRTWIRQCILLYKLVCVDCTMCKRQHASNCYSYLVRLDLCRRVWEKSLIKDGYGILLGHVL